jgi:phosphatidylglycerophosphate synthase
MTPPAAEPSAPRRVLATRNTRWAGSLAHTLARLGVRPNAVSVASIGCAAAAGAALVYAPRVPAASGAALFVAAAAGIQLRLLCNLLDGMLAVEEGLGSKVGALYNELPDRVADVVLFAAAGYALPFAFGPPLGWAAATLAVGTAYVRLLAGSLGLTQHFIGPMAKQHRMFTLTVASLVAALEAWFGWPPRALTVALILIVVGTLVTTTRRVGRLARELSAR